MKFQYISINFTLIHLFQYGNRWYRDKKNSDDMTGHILRLAEGYFEESAQDGWDTEIRLFPSDNEGFVWDAGL